MPAGDPQPNELWSFTEDHSRYLPSVLVGASFVRVTWRAVFNQEVFAADDLRSVRIVQKVHFNTEDPLNPEGFSLDLATFLKVYQYDDRWPDTRPTQWEKIHDGFLEPVPPPEPPEPEEDLPYEPASTLVFDYFNPEDPKMLAEEVGFEEIDTCCCPGYGPLDAQRLVQDRKAMWAVSQDGKTLTLVQPDYKAKPGEYLLLYTLDGIYVANEEDNDNLPQLLQEQEDTESEVDGD